jgi:hypothetical protein
MTINPRVWRDETALLIGTLQDDWTTAVYTRPPREMPDEFLVVRRTGGTNNGRVDRALMTIEVWSGEPGASRDGVNALAPVIAEYVRMTPTNHPGIGCAGVAIQANLFQADILSGRPRRVITATLTLKPIS